MSLAGDRARQRRSRKKVEARRRSASFACERRGSLDPSSFAAGSSVGAPSSALEPTGPGPVLSNPRILGGPHPNGRTESSCPGARLPQQRTTWKSHSASRGNIVCIVAERSWRARALSPSRDFSLRHRLRSSLPCHLVRRPCSRRHDERSLGPIIARALATPSSTVFVEQKRLKHGVRRKCMA